MDRLKVLGAGLKQNGEAIYDTTPWTHAEAKSAEGDDLRFTRKGDDLYVIVLGTPKSNKVTLQGDLISGATAKVQPKMERIELLGDPNPLKFSSMESNLTVNLPSSLPGKYAYVF